jgi:signal transduction histidine kinase/CheY-like chemotaxis protein
MTRSFALYDYNFDLAHLLKITSYAAVFVGLTRNMYFLYSNVIRNSEDLLESRRQLEIEKKRAEESMQAKGTFLANMSHEIRTPMNGVLGMTQLLLESNLNKEQLELATTINYSAESLLSIINDILDFSKIEAGKLEFSMECFNLKHQLGQIENMLATRISSKHINFSTPISDDIPDYLIGDPNRLRQVILNLTSNALKFTPEEGTIKVRADLEERDQTHVQLLFSVSDTGIGIPEDRQEKIFEAFSQADNTTTRNYGGTGLGLAISKQLVEMMTGTISLSSQEGVGSVFSFTARFPIGSKRQFQSADSLVEVNTYEHSAASAQGLRILLAEDNVVNQRLADKMLTRQGHSVVIVNNGMEAIESFKEESFDLILMDIQMPVMDGVQATQLIRQTMGGQKIPIIAMTAHAMTGDKEKYIACGMNGYLTKPFRKKELIELIARFSN